MTAENHNTPKPMKPHNSSIPHEVNCEELRALIPAYSIGATDPDETALVEAWLPYCPEAAAELTDYLVLADEFLYFPADTAPHMGSLDPMPELPPIPAKRAKPASPGKEAVSRTQKRPVRRSPWLIPIGVASAAALVLILFGASTLYWMNRVQQLQTEQLILASRLQEAELAMQPLTAGQVHHRELLPNQAVNVSDNAHATLIWNTAREIGTVYVTGLPPLAPDKTYQFWMVRDDGAVSLGTFRVDETGIGTLVFEAPEPIEEFQHIGISEEPATGSPMPTTPHLVIGSI
jgi:hypothetical protein